MLRRVSLVSPFRTGPSVRLRGMADLVHAENPWRLADQHKAITGERTVIITGSDPASQGLGQRLWFELQRCRVQSTFITMQTPYPVPSYAADALSIFRRTGAKSIIALGNGAVADFAKQLRAVVESGQSALSLQGTAGHYKPIEKVNLLCVSPFLTPAHFSETYMTLHSEEDVLIERWGRPVDLVVSDPSLTDLAPYQKPAGLAGYLLAELFDTVLVQALDLLQKYEAAGDSLTDTETIKKAVKEIYDMLHEKLPEHMPALQASKWQKELADLKSIQSSKSSWSAAMKAIAELHTFSCRRDPESDVFPTISIENWPGLIRLASQLSALNPSQERSLPYSYHSTRTYGQLLVLLSDENNRENYYTRQDSLLLTASDVAQSLVVSLTGLEPTEVDSIVASACAEHAALVKASPKRYERRVAVDKRESLTAGGHVEKLLLSLESLAEDVEKLPADAETRRLVLRGDLTVDLVERLTQ